MTVSLSFLDVFWLGMCITYKSIIPWFWEGKYVWVEDMLLYSSCGVHRINSIVTLRCVHFWTCILHNVFSGLPHFKAVTLKFCSSRFAFRRLAIDFPPVKHLDTYQTQILFGCFFCGDHFLSRLLKNVSSCQCCYLNVSLAVGTATLTVSSCSMIHLKHNARFSDVSKYVTRFQQLEVAFGELPKTTVSFVLSACLHATKWLTLDEFIKIWQE